MVAEDRHVHARGPGGFYRERSRGHGHFVAVNGQGHGCGRRTCGHRSRTLCHMMVRVAIPITGKLTSENAKRPGWN